MVEVVVELLVEVVDELLVEVVDEMVVVVELEVDETRAAAVVLAAAGSTAEARAPGMDPTPPAFHK